MKRRLAGVILAVGAAAALASGCARGEGDASASGSGTTRAAGGAGRGEGHEAAHHMNSAGGGGGAAAGAHTSAELAFLFPDGDDKGWSKLTNGVRHETAPAVPLASLPAPVRAQLIHQLALTAEIIRKFPTVKHAEAAGYRRVGPFTPGMGAHYIGGGVVNTSGALTDEEILRPASILYDGTSPESPVAGFMYMHEPASGSARGPEGFAGPNDHWHRHANVCLWPGENGATEALADGAITDAECKAKGGKFLTTSGYALHVWTVPAYTSPLGVFSHLNPALTCPDGSYHRAGGDITNVCRRG